MKLSLKKAHRSFYRYSLAFIFYVLWPFIRFASRKPSRYHMMNVLRKMCAFFSSSISGIFYRVKFQEPVDWSRTYIICPNHTSNLDIMSVSLLLKNNFCFMGKHELLENPLLGIFFKTIDIPVNRDSKMSSYRAFKQTGERLESGMSVVIFPEGTISKYYPPRLQEFKNGPFRLAIELKIPILPITSSDTWKVMWDSGSKYGSRPGICNIFVHKPIETAGMTVEDADLLKSEVYKVIKQKLDEHDRR
ncbi:MAG: 2-acyl-glycerophospho-ethanolamine acyltransferase [Mucilaginibacter sp.]|nr:2-acyl-glycerophospho-ethanolamine acyltransferase [Mucilaginibacter sp.]